MIRKLFIDFTLTAFGVINANVDKKGGHYDRNNHTN